jgi:microcin C transport system substrate-binding protein
MGSFRQNGSIAGIWPVGLPDRLVVGSRQGCQSGVAAVRQPLVDACPIPNGVTRRHALVLGAGTVAASALGPYVRLTAAQEQAERHGISGFGDLKYPADFHHFEYVDPAAPKGGLFSQIGPNRQFNQNFLTFNSLNSYILQGDAAQGMELTFATLMVRAGDEPDAMYGLAARAVKTSSDGLSYRFLLRQEAKFHDGSRLTAHDVAFSLNILKEKGHPIIQQLTRDFIGAEVVDDTEVLVRFAEKRGRDVPLFVAGLPIFSGTYYKNRPFDESTLEVPLGSGPYRVGRFEAGRNIEYERVKEWWGSDLPVMRGLNNFDTVRYEFYRDRDVAFVGFTAKNYLCREEFTSRIWANNYDFPAIRDGRVKRVVLPDDTPSGAQGWFINTRREKFRDPRLREALCHAFDFEWTNRNIMYGSYDRTHSVFQNSDMMAVGKPGAPELALLEPFRGRVPDEVFGEPFVPPVSDGSGQDRSMLRKAATLLQSAGYTLKDGKRVSPKGERITIEFLLDEPGFQPHHMPFSKNLAALGIEASVRLVDPVQYRQRRDGFDFDLAIERLSFSSIPGDSLRSYFSSQAAATKGTDNLAGVSDPVIDALIDQAIAADSRETLNVACRAIDRVFRAGRYWIPQWYKASHWVAYWDVFGRPPGKPRYSRGIPETWWYDPNKAVQIEKAG